MGTYTGTKSSPKRFWFPFGNRLGMGSKTKIGVRIDEDLWEAFTEWVEATHGRTHGTTGNELEHALREYMNSDEDGAVDRIEDDIASINANTADLIKRIDRLEREADGVDADGGAATLSNDDSTHIDTDDQDDKPHPKATVDEKVEWLIAEVFDDRESGAYVRADLIDKVRKHYSLSDDAVERMADAMLTKVGAKDTPQDNTLLAWGERLDCFREQAREEARKEAEDDFDDLDDAEPGAD